jgi:hypothetical protein
MTIGTDMKQRVAGPLATTAETSIAVLRWILIAFSAVVAAVWWISTRSHRH